MPFSSIRRIRHREPAASTEVGSVQGRRRTTSYASSSPLLSLTTSHHVSSESSISGTSHSLRCVSSPPGEGLDLRSSHFSHLDHFRAVPTTPAVAVGFLSINEKEEKYNPRDKLQYDLGILQHMFPAFPPAMLQILLVREEGNATEVAKHLTSLGWGLNQPKKGTRIDMGQNLSNQRSEHFEVPYFWGEFSETLCVHLLGRKLRSPGAFFTAVERPNRYIVVYLSKTLEVRRRDVEGPLVSPMLFNLYCLKRGLSRPSDIHAVHLLCSFN